MEGLHVMSPWEIHHGHRKQIPGINMQSYLDIFSVNASWNDSNQEVIGSARGEIFKKNKRPSCGQSTQYYMTLSQYPRVGPHLS